MERHLLSFLKTWLNSIDRKPLVIRGARQVGKTWLVRHFAKLNEKQLIEVNFEKDSRYLSLFESNDPQQILLNLSGIVHHDIAIHNSILFLDEIQAVPHLLAKLRWFAEDMPELPVIAAGSLLEFVLAEHSFSMPVGRISYAHLEPLTFDEFLWAHHRKNLHEFLKNYNFNSSIPTIIHEQLSALFREYILVGGMPAAVSSWTIERSLTKINQIHHDILATYRDDFAKYKGRIEIEKLEEVMMAVPKMLGEKFKYSQVNPLIQANTIKHIVNLLGKARICHTVQACAANGLPLAAEVRHKYFKEIYLDVGLCSAALGLSLNQINAAKDINFINNGGLAEQVAGQLLRTLNPPYIEPALFYWLREEKGSNAEIDYIMQCGSHIIPIEVKSGSTGSLKSLHLFMGLKKLSFAVRINSDLPSKTSVRVKERLANAFIEYQLLSIPFYLIGQLIRLVAI